MCGCTKKCNCDKKIFTKDIYYDGIVPNCLDPESTLCVPYNSVNKYLELLGSKLCELIAMGGIPGPAGPAGPAGADGQDGNTCALNVQIEPSFEDDTGRFNGLTSSVTGGSGTYTYSWSIVQFPYIGHSILSGSNTDTILTDWLGNYIVGGTNEDPVVQFMIYSTLFRVDVIDTVTGCIGSAYYMMQENGGII